jgi:hypothetical protein
MGSGGSASTDVTNKYLSEEGKSLLQYNCKARICCDVKYNCFIPAATVDSSLKLNNFAIAVGTTKHFLVSITVQNMIHICILHTPQLVYKPSLFTALSIRYDNLSFPYHLYVIKLSYAV